MKRAVGHGRKSAADKLSETMPPTDRYALQRRAGFPWLLFARDIEREFRHSFVELNRTRIRVAGVVGMLGCIGFIVMDQFVGMNLSPLAADLLLIGVTIPALLVPTSFTFRPQPGARLLGLIQIASILVSGSILAVICIGRATQPWFPYEALIIVTVYIYFVSGLLYYQAMFCSMLLWVAFAATNWTLQQHGVLLYEVYYLFLGNLISWLGLYMLERQSRAAFLLERELSVHAQLDSLTGMLNRRAFRRHLETAWRQAQRDRVPVGLMLIDLDGFKRVNDTGGHPFGDQALQRVGAMLKATSHRPLDAVGRYGGDEFIAIWFNVEPKWFEKMVEELPRKVAGLSCGDAADPVHVTISGGAVLVWPQPGVKPDDAIHMADQKLYDMKRTARGSIGLVRLMPAAVQAATG